MARRALLLVAVVTALVAQGRPALSSGLSVRASLDTTGVEANGASGRPVLSGNGRYVAFVSRATNLVAGDANGKTDVFRHDLTTGETVRVSLTSAGAEADGPSFEPSISDDGNVIAFSSKADNLVAGDVNGTTDVFVRDVSAGTTTRVSVSAIAPETNGPSYGPSISGDGLVVAFTSRATNMVTGQVSAAPNVFVRDSRATPTTARITMGLSALEPNGASGQAAISQDGNVVAFTSAASNLVAGDTNNRYDVFTFNRTTSVTTRVSVATGGAQADKSSFTPAVSTDGNLVAFASLAALDPTDANHGFDIYVHDTAAGITTDASISVGGTYANRSSWGPSFSQDGRYVAFTSSATNLVVGDANKRADVFVRDLALSTTTLVSQDPTGAPADRASGSASVVWTTLGPEVAYETRADNVVAGDTNGFSDVIVWTS